jgi:hypothetical protein
MRIIYFSLVMVVVLDLYVYTHHYNIMLLLKRVYFLMYIYITILIINCIEYLEKVQKDHTVHVCLVKRVNKWQQ